MKRLLPRQVALLRDLDAVAGTPTKMLAHHAFGSDGRQRSANAVYELNHLQGHGFVSRLDDQKPIAWIITAKGLAALSAIAGLKEKG